MSDDFDPASLTDEQIAAVLAYAGRAASARRKRRDRTCAMCGTVLENVITTCRYCSATCRARASYYRHKLSDPTAPFKQLLEARGWDRKRATGRPPRTAPTVPERP